MLRPDSFADDNLVILEFFLLLFIVGCRISGQVRDRESIRAWRDDPQHVEIQHLGREKIFAWYKIRICEIERQYGWNRSE